MSTQRTRPNRDVVLVVQLQSRFLVLGLVFCSDIAIVVLREYQICTWSSIELRFDFLDGLNANFVYVVSSV